MDYLDNTLDRPQYPKDSRLPKNNLLRKIYLAIVSVVTVYTGVKVLVHRKDYNKKVVIGRRFYRFWFPFIVCGLLVYPVDLLIWNKIDSQIDFWQTSIMTLDKIKK